MNTVNKALLGATLVVITAGGSFLYAQPTDGTPSEPTPGVVVPMDRQAEVSPAEMQLKSREAVDAMGVDQARVISLRDQARKAKDVIKLNCVNDKLAQIRELLKIVETSMTELAVAISSADEAERYHRYTMVVISGEKVRGLRDEAEGCIGEEIDYLGPLDVGVDQPAIPDDPTQDDPLDGADDIEPPGYASPFV